MNYYEHHLGDWAAATGHLTWDEDMAYTRLLRAYYHAERPIAYSTDRERGFHTIVNTGVERLTGHRCFTQVFTMGQGRPSGRRF